MNSYIQTDVLIHELMTSFLHPAQLCGLCGLQEWRHEHDSYRRPWSWRQTYRFSYRSTQAFGLGNLWKLGMGSTGGGVWGKFFLIFCLGMVSLGRVLDAFVLQLPYNVITVRYFRHNVRYIMLLQKHHFKALAAAINKSSQQPYLLLENNSVTYCWERTWVSETSALLWIL